MIVSDSSLRIYLSVVTDYCSVNVLETRGLFYLSQRLTIGFVLQGKSSYQSTSDFLETFGT